MLAELTHTHFEPLVGSTFRLRLNAAESLPLVLTQMRVASQPPAADLRRGFSLIFGSALPGHVPQHTYTLEHPALGALDLFIVPIGPNADGMQYQAVFG